MNNDIVEGKWKQLKGSVLQKWGNITDDDWEEAAGKREKFVGMLQEKEGKGRAEAEREFDQLAEETQ